MKLTALMIAVLLLAGSAAQAFDGNDRILEVDQYHKLPPNSPYDEPVAFGYVSEAPGVEYVPYGSQVTRTEYGVAPTYGYVARPSYGYVAPPSYVVPPTCGYAGQATAGYVARPTYVVPPTCGYVAPPTYGYVETRTYGYAVPHTTGYVAQRAYGIPHIYEPRR